MLTNIKVVGWYLVFSIAENPKKMLKEKKRKERVLGVYEIVRAIAPSMFSLAKLQFTYAPEKVRL